MLVKLLLEAYKQIAFKFVFKMYACWQKCNGNSSSYIKIKWGELQTELLECDWHLLCKIQQLSKQNGIQHWWREFGHINADPSHIFSSCVKIQPFWIDIKSLDYILNFKVPSLKDWYERKIIKGEVPCQNNDCVQ